MPFVFYKPQICPLTIQLRLAAQKTGLSCFALTARLRAPSHDPARDKDAESSASVKPSSAGRQLRTGVGEVPFDPPNGDGDRLLGRGALAQDPFPYPCKGPRWLPLSRRTH